MLTLPRTLTLTPAQFAEVCAANPEAVLELDALGHLIEMSHRLIGLLNGTPTWRLLSFRRRR